jgi:sugar phosphate permease
LETDLHLTDNQYALCLSVFFITYAAIEVPSNILLKRLKPHVWIPGIMIAWGLVMTLMGLVKGFGGLLTARLFLGLAEGGLYTLKWVI